jgi:hypothetical protein
MGKASRMNQGKSCLIKPIFSLIQAVPTSQGDLRKNRWAWRLCVYSIWKIQPNRIQSNLIKPVSRPE